MDPDAHAGFTKRHDRRERGEAMKRTQPYTPHATLDDYKSAVESLESSLAASEQKCAELAAALSAIKQRLEPPTKAGSITQYIIVQASEVDVLFSPDPLAAYRAQVEREVLRALRDEAHLHKRESGGRETAMFWGAVARWIERAHLDKLPKEPPANRDLPEDRCGGDGTYVTVPDAPRIAPDLAEALKEWCDRQARLALLEQETNPQDLALAAAIDAAKSRGEL